MNYGSDPFSPNPRFSAFPPAVKHLILINVVVFLALATPMIGPIVMRFGALFPIGSGLFRPWQLVSYMFLHAGFGHLFFNLFALWIFGQPIEQAWGTRRFTFYYFVTGIGAALLHMLIGGGGAPTVGASGAVYGILLAFGMMFPNRIIMLLFPPIPLPAKYFVLIYGAIELFSGVMRTSSGVAHFAHLGGMLVGYLLIRHWRRSPGGLW